MSHTRSHRPKSFAQLIDEEDAQLQAGRVTGAPAEDRFDRVVSQPGSAEEPWVSFTNRDRVGLAFSGGGIRSATFNLGLLQALDHAGVLEHVDYLGTVSGGGYVGGFWTAWRVRSSELDPAEGGLLRFPRQTPGDTADGIDGLNPPGKPSPREIRERPEIRHLREFSRFLMPRVGFMAPETWNGIVAILFGLAPSMFVTLAVLGLGISVWLLLNAVMLNCDYWQSGGIMFLLSGGIHSWSEWQFYRRGGAEHSEWKSSAWWTVPLLLSGLSAALMAVVRYRWDFVPGTPVAPPVGSEWVFDPGLINPSWGVFFPVLIWLLTALVLVSARLLCRSQAETQSRAGQHTALALDRGIARCLAPAVVWSTLGALWLLAIGLLTRPAGPWWHSVGASGGTAVVLTGLFAWLRDWLAKPVQATNAETLLRRLKPVLPQLLAYGAVAALFVLVSQGLLFFAFDAHHSEWPRLVMFCGACLGIILLALWLFDPMNIGLHEFYRSRITRCFLGAANPATLKKTCDLNRQTNERQQDDLRLREMPAIWPDDAGVSRALRLRPIHLVCCAANHLSGDPLGSLYRGARSAVLSQRGITLGNETGGLPDLRFSSALTASAAAFNSNMGAISMHLGAPVAFLMTALNLRLGLWVPHPRNPHRQRASLPGAFFFREMFGRTSADSPPARVVETDPLDRFQPAELRRGDDWRYLHLSDGAHFENLSLYELVRRHCRYLIISDCGADPEYSFDDLANAIRRVREDFGVEIEVDLAPLKPGADGFARQHAVAGTVHYDGVTGCDKGTLLYFKAGLTGNEPGDVLQYKTSNPVFPHEGTGDQFYDEAQWESYHRLGEHTGNECFRFLESLPSDKRRPVESIFHFARAQWQPGWQEQDEAYLALTARCAVLEVDIREHAPAYLRAEFFPEVAAHHPPAAAPTPDEEMSAVYFLMLITQVMEDAWLACRLETHGAHPLNEGWMSYLQRWAATPSFRRWWPILKPIYSPGFRHFAKQQFGVEFKDVTSAGPDALVESSDTQLRLRPVSLDTVREGFAWQQWERRQTSPVPVPPLRSGQRPGVFIYELSFASPAGLAPLPPLQIGVALVTVEDARCQVRWTTNQFFVPPALRGAGFTGRFLDALIAHFRRDPAVEVLQVTILDEGTTDLSQRPRPDPVSRARRVELVDFYKSRGFMYDRPAAGQLHEFNQLVCRVN